MPRLADIAKHADVSEATGHRVLNGKPGVAEATRQAVLTALDVLGYDRPSRLRRKSAGLVGLIVPELTNPIFPAFAQIIETALAQHGYTPVLCTQTPGGVHEDDYVQMLLDRGVAGIIYISGLHADTHDRPATATSRCATAACRSSWSTATSTGVDAPFISNDDVASMELSLEHLVQPRAHEDRARGRARPLRAGHPQDRRLPALDAGAARRPTSTTSSSARCSPSRVVRRPPVRLIDRGCTALVCGSDLMALGAIRGGAPRGSTFLTTSRSSATTTRPSSPSRIRR